MSRSHDSPGNPRTKPGPATKRREGDGPVRRSSRLVESAMGAFLVAAPCVEGFVRRHAGLSADLVAGVVLMLWAVAGYLYFWFLFGGT